MARSAKSDKVQLLPQGTGVFFQKWEQSEQRFVKNIYYQIQMRNHFIHSDESLNTDIYCPKKGFQALFENIKKIIKFL